MANEESTIEHRQTSQKESLLESLRETPLVFIACNKVGIGRSSYYRWRGEDSNFTAAADVAIQEGRSYISGLAESKIIEAINAGNLKACQLWLQHNERRYRGPKNHKSFGDTTVVKPPTDLFEKLLQEE
jgi:hypothetical protein